jgi:hypothetical protein
MSLLEQILRDMWIDPDVLAELSKDQVRHTRGYNARGRTSHTKKERERERERKERPLFLLVLFPVLECPFGAFVTQR